MITPDINRFTSTLLYPIVDNSLVYHDVVDEFFQKIPTKFIDNKTGEILLKAKKRVRDSLLRYLMRQYSVDSFDEIYQYLERWYLATANWHEIRSAGYENQKYLYMLIFNRLTQLSKSMVSKLDGQLIYKYWQTEGDVKLLGGFVGQQKIHLFRSMMQKIPMDLLVACFAVDKQHPEDILQSFRGNLAITDASLEKVLSKGVAENHIHTGVSTNFSIMWEELMCVDRVMSDSLNTWFPKIHRPNAPSKEIVYFEYLLARCLRLYLIYSIETLDEDGLQIPINTLQQDALLQCHKRLQASDMNMEQIKEYFYPLEYPLVEWITQSDTLNQKWIPSTKNPFTEIFFLYQMLLRLGENGAEKTNCIKKCFLNYLRLKHSMFQRIIQDKTWAGLDHFQTYYHTVSANRKPAPQRSYTRNMELNYQRLIETQLKTPHIRCVEFRMSFFHSEADAAANLRAFLSAYRTILRNNYCFYDPQTMQYSPAKKLPRIGIVFCFLKREQSQPDFCFFSDTDLIAYKHLHAQYRTQLEIFKKMRDGLRYPGIDRYLIGIDVASLENTVPTWVFSDLYDSARDSETEAFYGYKNRPFQSLRFTCHVGEDFRHLMSGLRRIHEAVHYLKFHTGDRIGHGLALGLHVERWCAEHPNVLLPRIEALENYIWAYQMLSEYPSQSKGSDLLYLEKRIHELAKDIYACRGETEFYQLHITTDALVKSYCELFSRNLLNQELTCQKDCNQTEDCILRQDTQSNIIEFILHSYHCHQYAMRMSEPIHYQIQPQEISIMKDLQEIMQSYISQSGIVVETNPTSNIIISSIDTIREHPIYQLSNPQCDYKDIMLCINSDDPGVFQTNTSNELGIAYMGMVEQGKGRNYCLEWIDKMRESGMQHTFINQQDEDAALLRELDELLDCLR